MKTSRIILVTVLIWLASTITVWLTCGWLFNWVYTLPPMIWLSAEEMMTTTNMIGSNVVMLVSGLLFVLVYSMIYKGLPYNGTVKGVVYGILIWSITALGMASMPFYMTVSKTVVIYWIIQALFIKIVTGAIVGKLCKK